MKKCPLLSLICCFWASFMVNVAGAEIVWDFSPDMPAAGIVTPCYTNQLESQQLAEK